jgi:hypothetical protein
LTHKNLVYEGEWENGRRQGTGKEYSVEQSFSYEGTQYLNQGEFVNGYKYGQGIYTKRFNDKIYVYDGTFYEGKFHGLGKMSVDGSEIFKGKFLRGKAEG